MNQYRKVENTCASCGGVQEQPLEQAQQLPGGWLFIVISERMAAVARTPQDAVSERVQYQSVVYPGCSAVCGAKLLMARALELARTKIEKEALQVELREVIDGG